MIIKQNIITVVCVLCLISHTQNTRVAVGHLIMLFEEEDLFVGLSHDIEDRKVQVLSRSSGSSAGSFIFPLRLVLPHKITAALLSGGSLPLNFLHYASTFVLICFSITPFSL